MLNGVTGARVVVEGGRKLEVNVVRESENRAPAGPREQERVRLWIFFARNR